MGKDMKRHFTEYHAQMKNKHSKRRSRPLAIAEWLWEEMQMKTTKFPLTHLPRIKLKKKKNQ